MRSTIPILVLLLSSTVGCKDDAIPTGRVTGTITVNGEPREGVVVRFVPVKKIRPAIAKTNADGTYEAQLKADQAGVPLGRCRAEFEIYKGDDGVNNYLAKFNESMADDPELDLEVFRDGLVFDYDIEFDGDLPPKK